MNTKDARFQGWRLGRLLNGDMFADWCEIERLNRRSTRLWMAANNSGGAWTAEASGRNKKVRSRCILQARTLASRWGWTVDMQAGLHWSVYATIDGRKVLLA